MPETMTNQLSNLIASAQDFIARLFDKKSRSVLGVDIGASSIKIVQLRRRGGRAVLETYGELALGPYAGFGIGQATNLPEEKVSEALRDIMREANVTTNEGAFSIPLAASLVVVIEMPLVSGEKLGEMVTMEARRYVPVPISEVALDFRVIPDEELSGLGDESLDNARDREALSGGLEKKAVPDIVRGHTRVLVAAIHNDTITKYQMIGRKSNVDIGFLEIETFSSMRSLLGREQGSVLILDIGAAASKASIIDRGVVMGTHVINRGSQDVTVALSQGHGIDIPKAEALKREVGLTGEGSFKAQADTMNFIMSSIFSEVNTMVFDYEKKRHKIIEKVILSGGGALLKGIVEMAQKSFGTQVVLADPFSKVESPAFLGSVLAHAGPNFAVATGVALRKLQEAE